MVLHENFLTDVSFDKEVPVRFGSFPNPEFLRVLVFFYRTVIVIGSSLT